MSTSELKGQALIETAITKYIELRHKRAELKRQYDEDDAKLKGQMEKIEVAMLGRLKALGVRQLATNTGMAYVERVRKPRCGDWSAFLAHIINTARPEMLQRRLSEKIIVDEFTETCSGEDAADGVLPPGVILDTEEVVRFRVK